MPKPPRIAILGFVLESNRFAPVVRRPDFERVAYFEGTAILEEVRKPYPQIDESITAFVKTMDEAGPWEPVPLVFANGAAAGPCDHAFFLELMADMRTGLEAAMPLDGVYFCQHGAAITTELYVPTNRPIRNVKANG